MTVSDNVSQMLSTCRCWSTWLIAVDLGQDWDPSGETVAGKLWCKLCPSKAWSRQLNPTWCFIWNFFLGPILRFGGNLCFHWIVGIFWRRQDLAVDRCSGKNSGWLICMFGRLCDVKCSIGPAAAGSWQAENQLEKILFVFVTAAVTKIDSGILWSFLEGPIPTYRRHLRGLNIHSCRRIRLIFLTRIEALS